MNATDRTRIGPARGQRRPISGSLMDRHLFTGGRSGCLALALALGLFCTPTSAMAQEEEGDAGDVSQLEPEDQAAYERERQAAEAAAWQEAMRSVAQGVGALIASGRAAAGNAIRRDAETFHRAQQAEREANRSARASRAAQRAQSEQDGLRDQDRDEKQRQRASREQEERARRVGPLVA